MTPRALAVAVLAVASATGDAAPGEVVRVAHRDPTTAPTRGVATALVTIELFFIPNTNAAVRMPSYRALERLQANHPTRIRLIYRVVKRGAQQQISIAALEAHAQGKFHEFMTELHSDRTTAMLTKDKVLDLARRSGMDVARLVNALAEGRYAEVFDANDRRLERLSPGTNAPNALFNAKPSGASLGTPNDLVLETEYVKAYERALELVDRGVALDRLSEAFELQTLTADQPYVGGAEDDGGDHKLANPPLDLAGLPSFGKQSSNAQPVLVMCRPNDTGCYGLMRVVRKVSDNYAGEIRLVWAPWFDVTSDSAAELAMLGDATLCAEQIGSSPEDLAASPGWRWINKQLETMYRARGRAIPTEKLIDSVTTDLEMDGAQLSACRARIANSTLDWIAKARRSGVARSPALVIGGRIYEGLGNEKVIRQLIDAELVPGILGRCSTIGCDPPENRK